MLAIALKHLEKSTLARIRFWACGVVEDALQ